MEFKSKMLISSLLALIVALGLPAAMPLAASAMPASVLAYHINSFNPGVNSITTINGVATASSVADIGTETGTNAVTVTFMANGDVFETQAVAAGEKATKPSRLPPPPYPTEGNVFIGWCADSEVETPYNFDSPVSENLTLYAKWGPALMYSMYYFYPKNTYAPGMFADVDENAWYGFNKGMAIASAYEYGLMVGNSATAFNPMGNMTVAEAITVAARVNSIYEIGVEFFIPSELWYQTYVDYAITHWIINSDDFSSYDRAATRAEMAYIFSRSLPDSQFSEHNAVNSLPDVDGATPYYNNIIMLYKAGVLAGNDDEGTFSPGNNITRAEAAAIISRVILPDTRMSGKTF